MRQKKATLWTLPFVAMILLVTFSSGYTNGSNSAMGLFCEQAGYAPSVSGLLVAVYMAGAILSRFPVGDLIDHVSHRKMLLLGSLIMAVPSVVTLITSIPLIIGVSRFVQGIGFSLVSNAVMVIVSDITPRERLGEGVAYRGLGAAFGSIIFPTLAIFFIEAYGEWWMFAAFCLVLAVCAAVAAMACHALGLQDASDGRASASFRDYLRGLGAETPAGLFNRYVEVRVVGVVSVDLTRRIVNGICVSFIYLYASGAGIEGAELFFIVAGASVLACRLLGARLFNKVTKRKVLVALSFQLIGFAALLVAPSSTTLFACAVGYGLTDGMASPAVCMCALNATPQTRWGVVNANVYFAGDMGLALGSALAGFIASATGFGVIPLLGTACAVVPLVLASAFVRSPDGI